MSYIWWRHQMEAFSALLTLCAGNSRITGEFPSQRPVTRSFDVFCDLRLNKPLSKQSWGWWFETPSRSLWRHCNDSSIFWSVVPLVEVGCTGAISVITKDEGNADWCRSAIKHNKTWAVLNIWNCSYLKELKQFSSLWSGDAVLRNMCGQHWLRQWLVALQCWWSGSLSNKRGRDH